MSVNLESRTPFQTHAETNNSEMWNPDCPGSCVSVKGFSLFSCRPVKGRPSLSPPCLTQRWTLSSSSTEDFFDTSHGLYCETSCSLASSLQREHQAHELQSSLFPQFVFNLVKPAHWNDLRTNGLCDGTGYMSPNQQSHERTVSAASPSLRMAGPASATAWFVLTWPSEQRQEDLLTGTQ